MAINVNYQHQLEQKQFFFRKGLERTWDAQEAKRVEKPWKLAAIVGGSLAVAICLLLFLTGGFAIKSSVYVDGKRYVVTDEVTVHPDGGYFRVGETFYSKKPKKESANCATNFSESALEVWKNPDSDRMIYLYWQPGGYSQEARKK